MSSAGSPTIATPDASHLRVAIVAAQWHHDVMNGLLAGTHRALTEAGVTEITTIRVPGSFELPVAAATLAPTHDAVVALGVVIRGGTPHFDYVCQAATDGLTRIAIDTRTPIGFGLLTCDTDDQARDRAGLDGSREDKGHDAATAAIVTALALSELDRSS